MPVDKSEPADALDPRWAGLPGGQTGRGQRPQPATLFPWPKCWCPPRPAGAECGPHVGTPAPPFICKASQTPSLQGLPWPFTGEENGRFRCSWSHVRVLLCLSTYDATAGWVQSLLISKRLSGACPVLLRARPWPLLMRVPAGRCVGNAPTSGIQGKARYSGPPLRSSGTSGAPAQSPGHPSFIPLVPIPALRGMGSPGFSPL